MKDSAALLADAELHLAQMAIPYTLAVYDTFLGDAIEILRDDGHDPSSRSWKVAWRPDPHKVPLEEAHDYLAERCQGTFPQTLVQLFDLARRIRNRIIHGGGRPGSRLLPAYRRLPPAAQTEWKRLARRDLASKRQLDRLDLGEGELVAVLAVTHNLAKATNSMLASTLSRECWARLAVIDYRTQSPKRFGEEAQRLRRVRGHARKLYGPLALTDEDLSRAMEKM